MNVAALLRWLVLRIALVLSLLAPATAWAEGGGEDARPALPGVAQAAPARDIAATEALDAPLVVHPASVRIPPVPADYIAQDSGWLRLRYSPRAAELVKPILRDADKIRTRLVTAFGHEVLGHVEVRVAPNAEEMAALAPEGIPPPAYATGVTYKGLDLILLSLRPPEASSKTPDLEEVFAHELVHQALHDATLGRPVPRWFHEGVAVHFSGEDRFDRMSTLWKAVLADTLVPFSSLDARFGGDRERQEVDIAYAQSADFVSFLLRDGDRMRFASFVDRVRGGQAFEQALSDAYGSDLRKLEYQWREGLAKRYTVLPVLTGGSLLWIGVIVLLVASYIRRRSRSKTTLARWEREEAAEVAALERLPDSEEALLAQAGETGIARASLPVIEHDGRWHTLH